MTDKEINELASQYAEYCNPAEIYEDAKKNGIDLGDRDYDMHESAESAEVILRWLSDRFCIVSREKVKKWSEESDLIIFDSIDLIEIFTDLFGEDLFTDKPEKQ